MDLSNIDTAKILDAGFDVLADKLGLPDTERFLAAVIEENLDLARFLQFKFREGEAFVAKRARARGKSAYRGNTDIRRVIIPASVSSIGSGAFCECKNLYYVLISDGVSSIGNNAFAGCDSLKRVKIPGSVKRIGEWAFCGCSELRSVLISEGVELIENGAFYSSGLRSIEIPGSVKIIGRSAFENTGLRDVLLPEGVVSIGDCAFYGWLRNLVIPDSVTSIGDHIAWYSYYNLHEGDPFYITFRGRRYCNYGDKKEILNLNSEFRRLGIASGEKREVFKFPN
ncbi:leucine-rich repeat domain-containing protein [bacterium]|nr:leucine-rich repeat domain-containing protein [bacterium]